MGRSARDIAGYRLVAGLGEGGMARVYLALSKKAAGFSKLVVLKVLRASTAEEPAMRQMFFDEARVAALLNHPNVVQTYEAGEDEGRLFLAMEYLEGKALSALLGSRPPGDIALDVHLRIISDMLEGLHYAHGVSDVDGTPLHIVHRDVSPQNVLVTFAGPSKVVDFGIAKIAGSPATQSGVIKGKVGYMAPEQIHNKGVDRRADVFAAGVMIWEAIAQRRLVRRGDDEVAMIARRMNAGDPSVRTVAPPGTPEELIAICEKAMSGSPDQRHATALELHDDLDRYLRKIGGADSKRVAELMESIFGEDRKRTRTAVEEQMRNADDSAPLMDIVKQRIISPPTATPSSPQLLGDLGISDSVDNADTKAETSNAHVVPPRSGSKLAPILLVVGVVAAIAFGTIAIVAAKSKSGSDADAASSALASALPTTAPAAASVHLLVRTNAEAATLLVDDQPQPLPYDVRVPRGTTMRLSARAPGLVDYDQTVTVDKDTNLDIALSVAPPASSASARPDGGLLRRKRPIDVGDPYRR